MKTTEEQFDLYLNELVIWNEKFNLTSITEREEIRTKHFQDSMTLQKAYDFSCGALSVIDIGTGAGFPGLPLKIAHPNIRLCLLDSVRKKTEFLAHMVNVLSLKDVEIEWARAEDLAKSRKDCFDVAVARAFAPLNVSAELCLPFVKNGGKFLAMKSKNVEIEIAEAASAIEKLGGELEQIIDVSFSGNERKIVVIKKIMPTPYGFPRKPGNAKKRPL